MEIKSLEINNRQKWDDYVTSHPLGTFFHLSGWKQVLEQSFAHSCHFLYAESQNQIRGVLPLGHIRSRLFGRSLISMPFCVYGGVLASDSAASAALEDAALQLGRQLDVGSIEYRNQCKTHPDWPTKDLYVTFRKEIDPDPDINLKAIPRKQRAVVRKGLQSGMYSQWDEHVDNLYHTYSESVRNLGTPVFGKKYFKVLKQVFAERCSVLTIVHEKQVISSVMNFYFRDEVLPYYGGGTIAARQLRANDFMYWELMRRSAEQGVRIFDYGRSKLDTGSYKFKTHWGFEPTPLAYQFVLIKDKEMPNVSPTNPKYELMIRAWKKLPIGVSRFIGPWIAKDLG
jgi:FemAB-related protein (PEP-CTERM system-associated)